MKPIQRSADAEKDVDEIVVYYSRQSLDLSDRFIGEYEASLRAIEKMPGSGSPRFQQTLSIEHLRAFSLHTFPYIIFYIDREKHIDVVRVLHSHRDVLALFLDQEGI